jgi:hypothetical protein
MYEVIICTVRTGRVERQTFASREQAARYVEKREAVWAKRRNFSLRDYRVEVQYLPPAYEPVNIPHFVLPEAA